MFAQPNRHLVQLLPYGDPRVARLETDIRALLREISSLDIALSNRDYVSQTVSEDGAHYRLRVAREMLQELINPED